MTIYQPGIPTGTVNLNVDYQNIKNNFQQLDTSFGVDHIPFSEAENNGYHDVIHFVPFSTIATNPPNNDPPVVPTPTSGFGQLFSVQLSDGFVGDEVLYFQSGAGRAVQLTGTFSVNASANGVTSLPGGLVFQWGFVSSTSGNPTVNYPRTFPNNIFSVVVTREHNSSSPGSQFGYWVQSGGGKSSFTIINNDGHTWAYNWMAIGN